MRDHENQTAYNSTRHAWTLECFAFRLFRSFNNREHVLFTKRWREVGRYVRFASRTCTFSLALLVSGTTGALSDDDDDDSSKLRTIDIALIAVVAVLGAGYIVMLIAYLVRRNKNKKFGGSKGTYVRPGAAFAPGVGDESEKMFETSKAAPFESFQPEHAPYGEGGRGHSTPYDAPSGSQ